MRKKPKSGAETRFERFMENINTVGVSKAIRDYKSEDEIKREVAEDCESKLVEGTAEDKSSLNTI